MRTSVFTSGILAVFLACIAGVRGEQVPFSQAPAAVQRTINTETRSGPVKALERVNQNGRNVYQVTFQQPGGTEKVIYLNNDGSYVQDKPAVAANNSTAANSSVIGSQVIGSRAPLSGASKVTFNELPVAVQNVLRTEAGTAAVEDI